MEHKNQFALAFSKLDFKVHNVRDLEKILGIMKRLNGNNEYYKYSVNNMIIRPFCLSIYY